MEGPIPGAEFYAERLARAQAVPDEQRSSDTKAWLALHSELEAATALLPPLPASATAQRLLLQPLGGNAALAGVLRFLANSFADPAFNPMPPRGTLRRLAPQLPPFLRVWSEGQIAMTGLQPALLDIFDRGGLDATADNGLEVLTRLLLVAVVAGFPEMQQPQTGLNVLAAIEQPLFASGASLDRQLARLQLKCGSGSGRGSGKNEPAAVTGGAGSRAGGAVGNLPTAAQLQGAWAALAIQLALQAGAQGLPHARMAAFLEKGARQLLRLQPDDPRSSFQMGFAAVANATTPGGASGLPDPLPHFLRGAELARQRGSDFWLARCAWMAAHVASTRCSPVLGPPAAAALLAEADAAYARCKPLCPPWWLSTLRADRIQNFVARDIISQHAQRSLDTWQPAIQGEQLPAHRRRFTKLMAKLETGGPVCDTCGQWSAELKWCPCRTARHCSTDCQRRDFKEHKLVCTAVKDRQKK